MSNEKTLSKALGEQTAMTVIDAGHAPFIFFEEAPALGHVNGMIRVTLSAERVTLTNGALIGDQVVTAYLRTNIQGARALVHALNAALLMAIPAEQPEPGKAN